MGAGGHRSGLPVVPAHLCVEGKVAKTMVSGKSAICIHQKVVPDSDSDSKRLWSNKVSSTGHDTVGGATCC